MKKILLTNFEIRNYSGSELDILTIANYFIDKNYEVDIFTLEFGEPLIKHVNSKIRIITLNNMNELHDEYSLIWSHHFPLLDYILFARKIKASKILYISLSSFEAYEALPEYYMDLTVIAAMSHETREKLIEEGCKSDIIVFPNYATKEYFKNKINPSDEIKNICIISNHIPKELIDFKDIAEKNKIKVDIYGMGYTFKLIDLDVLKKYDIVISIGKTIYYSTAAGIPSYVYDHFGGYGYLNKNNINNAFNRNFSGRGFGFKKTGIEIYNDITDNYKRSLKDLKELKKFAKKNYDFDTNMSKILKIIDDSKPIDYDLIYKKYPMLFRKSKLFVERMFNKINYISQLEKQINYISSENNKHLRELNLIYSSRSWKLALFISKMIKSLKKKIKI